MTAARKVEPAAVGARLAPVPSDEFDGTAFRAMARAAFDESGSADPAVATEHLLASLTLDQCRVALGVVLHTWMRNFGSAEDRKVRRDIEPTAVSDAPRTTPTTPQRLNAWYARLLETRLLAGAEWKFLRECNAPDLRAAAENRFKAATATKAEGARLKSLAVLMDKAGYSTVGDVPAADLKRIYGAAT